MLKRNPQHSAIRHLPKSPPLLRAFRLEPMSIIAAGILFSLVLFAGILLLMGVGRRIGAKRIAEEGEAASKGFGAVEGAVFGLLGLILAFLFSGALTRFDARRHL